MPADRPRQPLLHDLVTTLAAPTAALCGPDGQIRADGGSARETRWHVALEES